jgi:hypothetical protein
MMGCCGYTEGAAGSPRFKVVHDCCGEGTLNEACRAGGGFSRRYRSKEEKAEGLESYLKDLEAEAEAVREALADLK